MMLAGRLEEAGDARTALAPLLAVADSLPGDRLAPVLEGVILDEADEAY